MSAQQAAQQAVEPEPPEMFGGELDGPLFEALLEDLDAHAQIVEVRTKRAAEAHADDARVSLDQARMLLLLGQVRGVQIRYVHQGIEWIDTLIRRPRAIELFRVRVPGQPKRRLRVLD